MSEAHMSNEEFFAKLTELFDYRKTRNHGSIFLTQKRLSHGQDLASPTADDPMPDLHPGKPLPLIIRATNGNCKKGGGGGKVKLSTVVAADDLTTFYARYADICKVGMTSLKPRDRSKKKAKARKKKGGAAAGS